MTFVCSCVCKKAIKDEQNIPNNESFTDLFKKRSNNLKGFVKRHNADSCSFRLTFIRQENYGYKFKSKCINEHNHSAESNEKVKILIFNFLFIINIHFFNRLGFY